MVIDGATATDTGVAVRSDRGPFGLSGRRPPTPAGQPQRGGDLAAIFLLSLFLLSH